MSFVNAEPYTTTCSATTNHLPPISYGSAPRQCCDEAPKFETHEWDLGWLFNTTPSFVPSGPAMDELPPPALSPWVSPPLPDVCWPVVNSRRGTPNSIITPGDETPRIDYAGGFAAPSCQQAFVDVNNNWRSPMPPAPATNPPSQMLAPFLAPQSVTTELLPPFSCFLNPERHTMYSKRQVDINNNDIAGEVAVADEQFPGISSTPCPPVTTSPEISPIPPPPPPSSPARTAAEDPYPSPRIREILSDVLPRKRNYQPPLRKQFPELEGIAIDFIIDLIRTAKFGEGRNQRVAQEELESTTMVSLRQRLMEIVPGLAERGISKTSVARLLLPLNTRVIRSCLRDESAWSAVTEVLDIYDELDSVGTEILDESR